LNSHFSTLLNHLILNVWVSYFLRPVCYNKLTMEKKKVVFIALKDYDNLGIGYMSAVLKGAGFISETINLRDDKKDILETLKRLKPELVGFSVIYQYNIHRFIDIIRYLRKEGIRCHFTAGGHYASLKYKELFKFIPSLDSIVRFEGEYTLLELAKCIYTGTDWRQISGIAYKTGRKITANPLRPYEMDLDKFPYPVRPTLNEYVFKRKYTTLIAGRGCIYNCSFCNEKEYYRQSSGPAKRLRKPEMVVAEMEYLYRKKGCRVFLFEDDDFPVYAYNGSEWIIRFCDSLRQKKLDNKITWKINCRPDEIDEDNFTMMKNHGLFMVFVGIDDGTDSGLNMLNKKITVAKIIRGLKILKKLGLGFDFGFMLFHPWTDFRSLKVNIGFLRELFGDGYTPVTYNKLVPYYETRIESILMKEGRIKGVPGQLNYDFPDESMNSYYDFITNCFMEWLRSPEGLSNFTKWARNFYHIYPFFFDRCPTFDAMRSDFTSIVAESNLFLLDTITEIAVPFETGQFKKDKNGSLSEYKEHIHEKHSYYLGKVNDAIDNLFTFVEETQIKALV
jgi:anaerobic magnesium-protoporphyrin IX monomethyl ester cyclase